MVDFISVQLPQYRLAPRRINPQTMRSWNAIQLLNLIREHGRISRASLAKISRLSKPTVSELVSFLIQRDLVREGGEGASSARGGKKPTFVEFNACCGRSIFQLKAGSKP